MPTLTPEQIAKEAYLAADGRKAADIEILYVHGQTTLADYYIICSGQSVTQLRAIADAVDEALSKKGHMPLHTEGYPSASWILLDFGSVVVHVFKSDAREFYGLERLWADAPRVSSGELLKRAEGSAK